MQVNLTTMMKFSLVSKGVPHFFFVKLMTEFDTSSQIILILLMVLPFAETCYVLKDFS